MAIKYVAVPEAVVLDFAFSANGTPAILPFHIFFASLFDAKLFTTPEGIEARKSLTATLLDVRDKLWKELNDARQELAKAQADAADETVIAEKQKLVAEAQARAEADFKKRDGKVVLMLDSSDYKILSAAVSDPEYVQNNPDGSITYVKGYPFHPRACLHVSPFVEGVKNASTDKPAWI